jgi:hypothetical protein
MKNLLLAFTLVLTAATANATNTDLKFVSADNSIESNLCIIAAQEGYKAAMKQTANRLAHRTTCNGQSIKRFSKSYEIKHVTTSKKVVFVPVNDSVESKVCAQAVESGIKAASSLVKFNINQMSCNGKNIRRFVKQYSNT